MDIKTFFSQQFLFDATPNPESKYYTVLIIAFTVLVVFAVLVYFSKPENKKVIGRFSTPALTFGILGLLHLFGRFESLSWLGSRIFLTIITVLFFIWLIILAVWAGRFIPKHKKEVAKQLRYERYLPKNKRSAKGWSK